MRKTASVDQHSVTGRDPPRLAVLLGDYAHDTAVFLDDRPEDMPGGADVIAISPYLVDNCHDRGLAIAARRAGLIAVE